MPFSYNDTATTAIYTLSLHDALPISRRACAISTSSNKRPSKRGGARGCGASSSCPVATRRAPPIWRMCSCAPARSEEHTSELQSRLHLVCRLLLEKKKKKNYCQTMTE